MRNDRLTTVQPRRSNWFVLLPTLLALLGLVIYGLGSEFVAGAYRELNLDGADIGPSRTAILTVGGIFLLVGLLYVVVVAGLLLVVGLLVQRLWSGRRVARPRTQEAGFRVVLAALFLTNSGLPEPFSDSKIRMIGRIGASLIATGVGVFLLGVFPESIYNAGASYTRAAVSCRNAGFRVNSLASASDVSLPRVQALPAGTPLADGLPDASWVLLVRRTTDVDLVYDPERGVTYSVLAEQVVTAPRSSYVPAYCGTQQ